MRWRTIVVLALLGALAALGFALLRNSNIEQSYRAVAPLEVSQAEDEGGLQIGQFLTESAANAEAALRRENSEARVEVDEERAVLLFVGFGPTADAAAGIATAARKTYLELVPIIDLPTIDQQLAAIVEEVEAVQSQLAALDPPRAQPADRALETLLIAQIDGLRQRSVTLTLQLARGEGDQAEVETELQEIESRLIDLERSLSALQEEGVSNESAETALVRRALERKHQELEGRYQELYLQRGESSEPEAALDPVQILDETPVRTSPALGALIGLLGGAVLGLGGLMVEDRVRRPLWSEADLKGLPVLAELPRRTKAPQIWYPHAETGTRKTGIQSLRAAVQGVSSKRGLSSILVAGLGTDQVDLHMLAADLAASIAMAGQSVLLVDTAFDGPSELPEYDRWGAPSLAGLLEAVSLDRDEDVYIKKAVAERLELIPRLKSISAGSATDEVTDALAGDLFGALLAAAAESDALTIVAAPEVGHPITDTLERWMDGFIVVCTQGRTSLGDIEELAGSSISTHIDLLGVVILNGRTPVDPRRILDGMSSGSDDQMGHPSTAPKGSSISQKVHDLAARATKNARRHVSMSRGRHLTPRRSWLTVLSQVVDDWRKSTTLRRERRTSRPISREAWDV